MQISAYTKLAQTTGPILGGQKPKGRKNSNFFKGKNSTFLEAWEKETSNTVTKKGRKKEKAEIYCTNEGTNEKHRSPNK